jgi:hypothetical protein
MSAVSAKLDVGADAFTASTINSGHFHIDGAAAVTGQFDGVMIEVYPAVTSMDSALKIAIDGGATVADAIAVSGTATDGIDLSAATLTKDITLHHGSYITDSTAGVSVTSTGGAGAVVAGTCTAAEYEVNGYHKTVLTLLAGTTFALEDKDDGGGIKVYDFPEGQVIILGTQVDATITLDTNVTAPYVMAIGTVIGVDSEATLTTTEANFVATTAVTNGVGQNFHGVSAAVSVGLTGEPYNGTSAGLDLFVNAAIAAGSISPGGATLAATGGTVTVWWMFLGDY